MYQDIAPHCFNNVFLLKKPAPEDLLFCFQGDTVLLRGSKETLSCPCCGEMPAATEAKFLFQLDDRACFFLDSRASTLLPQLADCKAWEVNALRDAGPGEIAFTAQAAAQLVRWYRNRKYCGCCGSEMQPSETERALVCDCCGLIEYPKISPAVIVAVTNGDQLLLTQYANRPYRRWALVAGFNEIGETIEETVCREVWEETGLAVQDLRYYKSQPWCFTDSLLLGFFCCLSGDATPRPDGVEIAEARWFSRAELPVDERTGFSLTQEMIAAFRYGEEPR